MIEQLNRLDNRLERFLPLLLQKFPHILAFSSSVSGVWPSLSLEVPSAIMPSRFAWIVWLACCFNVRAASTTSTARDLAEFYADPTVLVQFVPSVDISSLFFTSAQGFLNQHVTMFSADVVGTTSTALSGILMVQLDNSGVYSHVYTTFSGTPGGNQATTYMSCTGAVQGSVQTCKWTVQSQIALNVTATSSYPVTSGTSTGMYTFTATSTSYSYPPSTTSSGVFTTASHLHTLTMQGMLRPRTSNLSS